MKTTGRFLAVIPAAGTGSRMGAAIPKQYLPLAGRTVLEWSVRALLAADWIERVVVVHAPGDARAAAALADAARGEGSRLRLEPLGGATRRDSVLAGLQRLEATSSPTDWALVHDAARPGLGLASLERLREAVHDDPVGGLLALPVADTVKRADAAGRVLRTEARERLWLAQTPQMFRLGPLLAALRAHPEVTDEASAIEAAGLSPRLVEGERRNLKVTTPEDLELMAALFGARELQ
jgi:2-C-methyl-D-erythritol 4-phosphate cytidylyltransferase